MPAMYPACQDRISFSDGSSDREEMYFCMSILAFLVMLAVSLEIFLSWSLLILYLPSSVDKILCILLRMQWQKQ